MERSGEREKGAVATDREEKGSKTRKHMIVCAVVEVGLIIHALNTAALPLVAGESGVVSWRCPSSLLEALKPVLSHKSLAVRLAMILSQPALSCKLFLHKYTCLLLLTGKQGRGACAVLAWPSPPYSQCLLTT